MPALFEPGGKIPHRDIRTAVVGESIFAYADFHVESALFQPLDAPNQGIVLEVFNIPIDLQLKSKILSP